MRPPVTIDAAEPVKPAPATPHDPRHEHPAAHSTPGPDAATPWPFHGVPHRSGWRLPAAGGAIAEAAGHIPVTQEHLTQAPYIGVGFVLLTVSGVLLAQLLLLADTTVVWSCTAAASGAALLGYLLSRTVGLPQIRDDVGDWNEPLGIVCVTAEAIMLLAAGAHLASRRGCFGHLTRGLHLGRHARDGQGLRWFRPGSRPRSRPEQGRA